MCGNRKSRNIENNCPIHEYSLHLRNRHNNGVTTNPSTNGYIFLKHNLKTRGEIEINLTAPQRFYSIIRAWSAGIVYYRGYGPGGNLQATEPLIDGQTIADFNYNELYNDLKLDITVCGRETLGLGGQANVVDIVYQ